MTALTPKEVALHHAVIGFERGGQGLDKTMPQDLALCLSCGWFTLSEYTAHLVDLMQKYEEGSSD